jgi:FkbM family methyltransferase
MRLRGKIKHFVHSTIPGKRGWFPYFGCRVYFPDKSLIFAMSCDQGIYEEDLVKMLLAAVEENSVMFDLGANIGLMAIPVLQSGRGIRVCSFEPSPNTLPYLRRTQASSPWADRWEIIPKAAGSAAGEAVFSVATADVGALDGFKDTARAGPMTQVKVPVATLDEEWIRLGKPRVSVIKIDIEGAETMALAGATQILHSERPLVFLEWNASNLAAYDVAPSRLLDIAAEFDCDILAVPGLAKAATTVELRLHMAVTETFLLLPRRK